MSATMSDHPGVLRESLTGAGLILANLVAAPVRRGATNRWGATPSEVAAAMPGDDLVPAPRMSSTRAITIAAPPAVVWAWLDQIGHGRAGLYSYDGLENLVGCDLHSADSILVDAVPLAVGDLVALGPVGYPCFRGAATDAPRSLVLLAADRRTRRAPTGPVVPGESRATWQWQLQPRDDGATTRLVARQRYAHPRLAALVWRVVEPIDFVMERRMLRGIEARATGAGSLRAAYPVSATRG